MQAESRRDEAAMFMASHMYAYSHWPACNAPRSFHAGSVYPPPSQIHTSNEDTNQVSSFHALLCPSASW